MLTLRSLILVAPRLDSSRLMIWPLTGVKSPLPTLDANLESFLVEKNRGKARIILITVETKTAMIIARKIDALIAVVKL